MQMNNISFIYQWMLWYWKVIVITWLGIDEAKAMSSTKIYVTCEYINCKKLIFL